MTQTNLSIPPISPTMLPIAVATIELSIDAMRMPSSNAAMTAGSLLFLDAPYSEPLLLFYYGFVLGLNRAYKKKYDNGVSYFPIFFEHVLQLLLHRFSDFRRTDDFRANPEAQHDRNEPTQAAALLVRQNDVQASVFSKALFRADEKIERPRHGRRRDSEHDIEYVRIE